MTLLHNLPALQIILPLTAAPLIALLPRSKLAWLAMVTVAIWTFGIAVALAITVSKTGMISYAMGGWKGPIGIEYRIDQLNSVILLLVSGIGAATSLFAYRSVNHEVDKDRRPLFYGLFLLCLAGLLGITITNDAFNIYVFLEIASLASYSLIGMGKDRQSLVAAINYLIIGTVAATFILIGIGLLYMMTGTLNITDLAARIAPVYEQRPIKAAFAFILIGLAIKMALFPLHSWLPNAYVQAPSFIAAFLSGTATKVAIYLLIRVCFTLFGVTFMVQMMHADTVLMLLAIAAMLYGSVMAVRQSDVKWILAYSSIAQVGMIILGISLFSRIGIEASMIHLVNHGLAKSALFMAAGCVALRMDSTHLDAFRGLGRTMPWTMTAFALAAANIVGIPFTGGFLSKWLLLHAVIEKELWLPAIAIVISSVLALFYVWRIIEVAYFSTHIITKHSISIAPTFFINLATWMLVTVSIVMGIWSGVSLGIAARISHYLIAGS